ncbi:hypothetical protein LEP1GSC079_3357 [Leptospira interrogans str. FPW1039]|uniref:Uncharacterized protein n=1 Tax=Leptospira interrogans str. FPW1039 TaxID=1193040 RepID=A0A0F6IHE3_LEPIR|nr:hypothetical protein LEP1GSC096_0233 [Leptospira interrogans serovar Hebdomadis str. R499]EKR82645.1 hypothetical protein LEP1GSC099_2735 [Leptospira interrogans str. UI 08452]EMJ37468.1 hypothetical protein LEP1GSC079_3357 [Leptospira interrogans str. FPW1039]EMN35864.1 hypothetical protein LEP1GSC084_3698 [Leptospira interrogans serovar Medanensis str. L0448]EMN40402.1 hypothetical protein LEP1GSC085_3508 [Leptospira interrogans str. L0996]EMN96974.1 hypothetical protein LEP1GSC110_1511 [
MRIWLIYFEIIQLDYFVLSFLLVLFSPCFLYFLFFPGFCF